MREVSISELNWTFDIRNNIQFLDSSFDSKGRIIDNYRKVNNQEMISLFKVEEDNYNWVTCLIIKDTSDIESWARARISDKSWYFGQLYFSHKVKILDTLYSEVILAGRNFKREFIKIFDKALRDTINRYHFYTKFKTSELVINISFTDKEKGVNYLDILNSSRFGR